MRYVGRRHHLADHCPLRSLPMFRTVESVFGVSPQVKAEAELRLANEALGSELRQYAADRAALGVANRRPINWQNAGKGCRAYHQGIALRAINARRKLVRAAQARVAAAEAAVAALTVADAYSTPFLAQLAAQAAITAAPARLAA